MISMVDAYSKNHPSKDVVILENDRKKYQDILPCCIIITIYISLNTNL